MDFDDGWDLMYVAAYQDADLDNKNGSAQYAVDVRPMYKRTLIVGIQLEIGCDNTKSQRINESNNQYKITLA